MLKSVLITGASAGLGRECARQLARYRNIEKIWLCCVDQQKVESARQDLEHLTGRRIFEPLVFDLMNTDAVRSAAASLPESVDGLLMNAGGTVGKSFKMHTQDGVTQIVAINLLGHVVLVDALLKADKLKKVALYAGSEAARGVKEMGMKQPAMKTSSVDEFASICDGRFFRRWHDATAHYGPVKYLGAMWMASLARQNPEIRFVTMSPGATVGTEGYDTLPFIKQHMMKAMMHVMLRFEKVHGVEEGAARYVDGFMNEEYKSGRFYASVAGLSGEIGDQSSLFSDLENTRFQDNASKAIHRFIK